MTSFKRISTYRTALMGVAMLSVFCFHAFSSLTPSWIHALCSKGYRGVDVFLFLSAIGLCFSMEHSGGKLAFYKRRFQRIFPTYWLIMSCVYLFVATCNKLGIMPDNYYRYPHTIWEIIQAYTTIGFWIKDGVFYLWYIPALIIFYIAFPFIYELFRKSRWFALLCLLPSLLIMYITMPFTELQLLFIKRIGIFMFGVVFYPLIKQERQLPTWSIAIGFFLMTLYGYKAIANLEDLPIQVVEDVLFYMSLPFILLSITTLFRCSFVEKALAFVGTVSLEFYLVHEFILRLMGTASNFIIPRVYLRKRQLDLPFHSL
ncbi:MAG: acyltransferase [Paraprevotella sp.]|nr:acyltransferase [Paraprevotella sp.]